jgi:hypothetical protein
VEDVSGWPRLTRSKSRTCGHGTSIGTISGAGRAIAAGIRTILQRTQSVTQAQPPNLTVAEDDIASAFRSFLLNDVNWMAYLRSKAHMTGLVHLVMTDTVARFIAWEAYADITK